MESERLIIQNLRHAKVNEGLEAQKWNAPSEHLTNIQYVSSPDACPRECIDLIEVYTLMASRGYGLLPELTCEKRALRCIESKLSEYDCIKVKLAPVVPGDGMPIYEINEDGTTTEKTFINNKNNIVD